MCKEPLRNTQMTFASPTQDGQLKAADLVRWETRFPGDTRAAMERIARSWAIPFSKLWALRYRPPKEIGADLYAVLCAAHSAEVERQRVKLTAESAAARPATAFGRRLVGAAARLGGQGLPTVIGD